MAQWVCRVLLPFRPAAGRLSVLSLLPAPRWQDCICSGADGPASLCSPGLLALALAGITPGPPPLSPLRAPPPAAGSASPPWTQSVHTAQRLSSKGNKRNCLGPHGCGPHLHTRAEPPEPSLYPGVRLLPRAYPFASGSRGNMDIEVCHLGLGGQADIMVWAAYGWVIYDVEWKRESKGIVGTGPAVKRCVVLSMATG